MKKLLIVIGSLFAILFIALLMLPSFFKEDIKKIVDKEIDKALDAKVYYQEDDISITLFRHFPNLTLSIANFGIVGIGRFEKDTLLDVSEFSVDVNLLSAIQGSIGISQVFLDKPAIKIYVHEDGSANYDIVKPSEEVEIAEESTSSSGSGTSLAIHHWEINEGTFLYDDETLPFQLILSQLEHSGSGNLEENVFDLSSTTTVGDVDIIYDGVRYVHDKKVTLEAILAMDLDAMKFTFKENKAAVNDFHFHFDGFVAMPTDDIDIQIDFLGDDIDLKSIISLIPGAYQEYLDGVTASGSAGFDGFVKGTYNENSMPRVFTEIFVKDGKIAHRDYPVPLEGINIDSEFDYPSADLRDTEFNVNKFALNVNGSPFTSYLKFKNLENYQWDFGMNGKLDLEKITQLVPLEGMELKGIIDGQFQSKGTMSAVENEQYDQLPTSGQLTASNFYFDSEDLADPFTISSSNLKFDPSKVELAEFKAALGKNDFELKGMVENYLGFALKGDLLSGDLGLKSSYFNLNPFMTEESDSASVEQDEETDTTTLEVVEIPKNIDFLFHANMKQVIYDNLTIKDAVGEIAVKDGKVILQNTNFDLLDGHFKMDGYYSTENPKEPAYDFTFGITDLSIPSAYESFNTVKKMAPVAKNMTGKFSTDFKLNGALGTDMMPLYETMQGLGAIKIADAELKESKLTSAISGVSKLNNSSSNVTLKDVLLDAEVKDGRVHFSPFDINLGGKKATIQGSNGVDGTIDYSVKMDVPSAQLASLASSLGFGSKIGGSDIKLNLKVLGTYDKPKVSIASAEPGSSATSSVTTQAKAKVSSTVNAKKDEVKEQATKQAEEQKKAAEEKAQKEADKLKEKAKEEQKKATDKIKGLFGR